MCSTEMHYYLLIRLDFAPLLTNIAIHNMSPRGLESKSEKKFCRVKCVTYNLDLEGTWIHPCCKFATNVLSSLPLGRLSTRGSTRPLYVHRFPRSVGLFCYRRWPFPGMKQYTTMTRKLACLKPD